MKLCMSMWSFQELLNQGEMDFSAYADYCGAHKIQYADLLEEFMGSDWQGKLAVLKEKGIQPAIWSVNNNFVQKNEAGRQGQIDYMLRHIDLAKQAGISHMRVFAGDAAEGISFEEGMQSILACYRRVLPYAEERGMVLCLENHGNFAAASSQVNHILDYFSSENLRSTFDTANFLFVDEDPLQAAKALQGKVNIVHFKDYAPSPEDRGWASAKNLWYEGCPLGKGIVPLKQILKVLAEGGFDGYVSMELESSHPIISANESVAFCSSIGL